MKNISRQTRDKVYQTLLLYPSKSNYTIADEFGLSETFVRGVRTQYVKAQDTELLKNAAGMFLSEFQECGDRLKSYIAELEVLKTGKKTIVVSGKDGKSAASQVPLDPTDIGYLIKIQVDTTKQVLHMAAQPRLITVIKTLRDQKFQKPEF